MKERVKNVLNYKKPAFWVIIVSVVACIAVGVFFLTNPKGDKPENTPDKDENAVVDADGGEDGTDEKTEESKGPKWRCTVCGYIHEGDLGIRDREAFRYTGKQHLQIHHLYVCPSGSRELHRHLTFRNYLRTHPEAVREYSRVKETAARHHPDSIEGYMEFKNNCIAELCQKCGL